MTVPTNFQYENFPFGSADLPPQPEPSSMRSRDIPQVTTHHDLKKFRWQADEGIFFIWYGKHLVARIPATRRLEIKLTRTLHSLIGQLKEVLKDEERKLLEEQGYTRTSCTDGEADGVVYSGVNDDLYFVDEHRGVTLYFRDIMGFADYVRE